MDKNSHGAGFRKNYDIRAQQVRLIDDKGNMLGIFSLQDALEKAFEANADLVETVPDAAPPVCKIIDYSRLRYQEQKKSQEMRKRQKISVIKEIQLRPNIQEHDYQVKLSNAKRFLENGDRVRLILQFRGREANFMDIGKRILDRFMQDLELLSKIELLPKMEGRRLVAVLAPLGKSSAASPTTADTKEAQAETAPPVTETSTQ